MSNTPARRSGSRLLLGALGIVVIGVIGLLSWRWLSQTPGQVDEAKAPERTMVQAPAATQPAPANPSGGEVTIDLSSREVIGAPTTGQTTVIAAAPTTPATPVNPNTTTAPAASQSPIGQGAPTATQGASGSAAGAASADTTTAVPSAGVQALDDAIAMADRDPVRARVQLTRLLEGSALSTGDRLRGYDAINRINGVLVFSNRVVNGDPYSIGYKVEPGDSLARIAKAQKLDCDWRLVQRINGVSNPNGLKVGQAVKLPKGTFHGEVRKSEYRLNMYIGEGPDRVMIASYPIGLGELNTTPTGAFIVRPKSKLIDPEWRNPRTGEFFQSNDPKNPIGERWIGLKGIEPHNKGFEGYGIHGTVDLESIGQQRSMGCVRMRPLDVELVYEMLTEPNSTITIAP